MKLPISRYEVSRAKALFAVNPRALSDCCGAPIMAGGFCFDCHESCRIEDDERSVAPISRTVISDDDLADFAYVESPYLCLRDEESASAMEEIPTAFAA